MFYWIKTSTFIKKTFSNYIWDLPNTKNKIYLTFDDGPTPLITEWVMSELEKYHAKATFFCIGKNIEKHPKIFEKLIIKGHSIGNHTFNHLNGWKTSTKDYIENCVQWSVAELPVAECGLRSENNDLPFQTGILNTEHCRLFRPPYGKMKPSQAKRLQELGYKIILWDVLSADFDTSISKEKCLKNVIKNVQSGSIIVFHDSSKAFPNLEYTLPNALKILSKRGFVFESIC